MEQPRIIYDDAALLIINKPAGWVVHEGAGDTLETIVDWFVKNYPQVMEASWDDLSRIGIVHRLDKDTSGLMVLAKTPEVLQALQTQFKDRSVKKVYRALVYGLPKEHSGTIETYIGRNPKRRQEQAVLPIQRGEAARRFAITEYSIQRAFRYKGETISDMLFTPKTGRMHQLRVHAKYLGTPILGDQTYTIKPAKRLSKALALSRQLLHASKLSFTHPSKNKILQFEVPLPHDMSECIAKLTPTPVLEPAT